MSALERKYIVNFFKRIIRFVSSPFPLKAVEETRITPIDVIKRRSRGNVRLQLGKVMFSDEYRVFRAKVSKYEF